MRTGCSAGTDRIVFCRFGGFVFSDCVLLGLYVILLILSLESVIVSRFRATATSGAVFDFGSLRLPGRSD